jgi:hypothetical protein
MSTHALTTVLRIGGYTNIIGSPLIAVFYRWLDAIHCPVAAGHPVWVYSFFYCTTILGLVYIQAARDPVKYRPFVGMAVMAKLWGIAACLYAVLAGSPWLLLVGVYDIAYGICFFVLYRRLGAPAEEGGDPMTRPPQRRAHHQDRIRP